MASYGAKYIKWAPFAENDAESGEGYPKYGAALVLSKLVKVTDNPTYAEGKLYGDDELAEYASEFVENDIDIEVTEISNEMAKGIFGASLEETEDLAFGSNDSAPYGGLAFICCKMVNGKKSFQGVYLPKNKSAMQGEEYNTKGDSITFGTGKIKLKGSAASNGKWKVKSKAFPTEAEAKAWVDEKLPDAGTTT